MSAALVITLLLFAAIGFAGAGVALALGRARMQSDATRDFGTMSLTLLLGSFGAACTYAAAGVAGIFAYGGVIVWFSYVVAAHQIGVFELVRSADSRRPRTRAGA